MDTRRPSVFGRYRLEQDREVVSYVAKPPASIVASTLVNSAA